MVAFDTLALAIITVAAIREVYLRLRPMMRSAEAERG